MEMKSPLPVSGAGFFSGEHLRLDRRRIVAFCSPPCGAERAVARLVAVGKSPCPLVERGAAAPEGWRRFQGFVGIAGGGLGKRSRGRISHDCSLMVWKGLDSEPEKNRPVAVLRRFREGGFFVDGMVH